MTFVQDVSSDQQQGKNDKKCVLKITKAMDISSFYDVIASIFMNYDA